MFSLWAIMWDVIDSKAMQYSHSKRMKNVSPDVLIRFHLIGAKMNDLDRVVIHPLLLWRLSLKQKSYNTLSPLVTDVVSRLYIAVYASSNFTSRSRH